MLEIGASEDRQEEVVQEEEHDREAISMQLDSPGLSKRQKKRLAKRQKWLANKSARRAKEKEKRKKRKAERNAITFEKDAKRPKICVARVQTKTADESDCRIKVILDLAYDNLMDESEISKTCKQIQRCYAINRRTENPLQLYITNYSSHSMEKLAKNGCDNWDVHREPRRCEECFNKEEIVYLSSESTNILTILDESKVYVIGGLVDHNKHKGLCLSIAEEKGFGHARLPIDEFVTMKTRKVLSIVHVFEILLNVTCGMTWPEALMRTLPKRKLPSLIPEESEEPKDSNKDDNGDLI